MVIMQSNNSNSPLSRPVNYSSHDFHVCYLLVDAVDDAKKERVKSDLKHAQDLGLIEVRVKRGISHGNSYHGPPAPHKADEKLEFAEKSLKGKAISHAAT